jgi:hypothetical protein
MRATKSLVPARHDEVCAQNGPLCTAQKPGNATIRCFRCQRWVCLSCTVKMDVRYTPGGVTFGTQFVCHGCACTLHGGMDIVKRHLDRMGLSRMAPGRVTVGLRVPESAPALREAIGRSAMKRKPLSRRSREAPAPAAPKPYPQARMELLGYARSGK